MALLGSQAGVGAAALEPLILTATRNGDVPGTTWYAIDLAERIWTIPANRMKANREHRVPLSLPALAALQPMKRLADGSTTGKLRAFPGRKAKSSMSEMTFTAALRRMGRKDLTVHDFRSTFRT